MGIVYKAVDVNLERPVAVKVMAAAARNEPDFVERFREEARMQGALNHPNVAVLFDYFIHAGHQWRSWSSSTAKALSSC